MGLRIYWCLIQEFVLFKVPEEEWFCSNCTGSRNQLANNRTQEDDELENGNDLNRIRELW